MSSRRSIALSLLVLWAAAASFTTSCNVTHCENLRDELTAQKQEWQACEKDTDCIIVGGNQKDCTGIFSCDTAVNRRYREDAERRIASLPEETVDCVACKGPNCISGEITLCEPVTKTCIIVTEILDGGTTPPPSGMPDAGDMPAGSLGDGGTP